MDSSERRRCDPVTLQTTWPFQAALRSAYEEALAFLQSLARAPVGATADEATLRERLFRPLEDGSVDAKAVVEELVRDVEGRIHSMPGGRFLYACGPAAAIAEETAGEWLKELLQLPPSASFAGLQRAPTTAVCSRACKPPIRGQPTATSG